MSRKLAVSRIIGFVVAVVGIGVMVFFTLECNRLNDDYLRWQTDMPMALVVDFSGPGQYTTPFKQTCSLAHPELVMLDLQRDLDPSLKPEEALQSLRAQLVIKNNDGELIATSEINSSTIAKGKEDRIILLTNLRHFARGEYTATFQIESGVPALKGTQQFMFARYHLYGVEKLPAYVAGAFAALAGLVGIPTLIVVIRTFFWHGIWQAGPRKSAKNAAAFRSDTPANGTSETESNGAPV